MAAALALYAFGWSLEDPKYFLRTQAVVAWSGAVPLVLAITAFGWRARWGAMMLGGVVALAIAITHVGVYASLRNFRVNDDAVGIAAVFAGAALAGWLAGRGMHEWVRRGRAGSDS